MRIVSRRRFLATAAVAPLVLQSRSARLATAAQAREPVRSGCLLLDAGEHCALPESLAGFARGLQAAAIPYGRVTLHSIEPARFIVVPGAVLPSSAWAATLRALVLRGSTVVYESGAAYAAEAAFRTEQRLLSDHFQVSIQAPLELWARKDDAPATSLPYVHYHWPMRAMVRDFSRAIPVIASSPAREDSTSATEARSIASIRRRSIACRRRLGDGQFIFLGSPLGPHVGGNDREAHALLGGLLSDACA
jgi:hypothetical protein